MAAVALERTLTWVLLVIGSLAWNCLKTLPSTCTVIVVELDELTGPLGLEARREALSVAAGEVAAALAPYAPLAVAGKPQAAGAHALGNRAAIHQLELIRIFLVLSFSRREIVLSYKILLDY